MASNQGTTGESEPDDNEIFETKLVEYNGYQVRIVTQDKNNGPCPLIAVCNVLLLKNKFVLDGLTVSADILLTHVAEQLFLSASSGDRDQDINQAIDALPRFRTGIDVNFRFNKIDGFLDTPELAVFRLLEIPLYHGWIVDPQDSDTAKAFGSKPYNTVINEVADFRAKTGLEEKNILQEDCGDNQKGKGDVEEEEALLRALSRTRSPLSPHESVVPGTTISHASVYSDDHGLIMNTGSGVFLSQDSSAFNSCYTGRLSVDNEPIETNPSVSESAESVISNNLVATINEVRPFQIQSQGLLTIDDSRMTIDEKLGPVYESEVAVAKQVEGDRENDCDMDLSPFIIRAKGLLMYNFLQNNPNQLTIYGLSALRKGLKHGELCVFFRNNHFSTMLKHMNELYLLSTDQDYISQPDFVWAKLNEANGVTGDFNIFASRLTTGQQVKPGSLDDLFDGAEDYYNDSDSEGSIPSPPVKL
ncbi:hypothetical protein MKW94_015086 [Papaver nudicaule]|uniref:MINDY deubiquitinase domain-containing protein n=1 Tax=Papaver nudicaule TaxID=74823 RepID=A0AA41V224_PAPNU|nr:hypothetical protein [Papaver nudicaule]